MSQDATAQKLPHSTDQNRVNCYTFYYSNGNWLPLCRSGHSERLYTNQYLSLEPNRHQCIKMIQAVAHLLLERKIPTFFQTPLLRGCPKRKLQQVRKQCPEDCNALPMCLKIAKLVCEKRMQLVKRCTILSQKIAARNAALGDGKVFQI